MSDQAAVPDWETQPCPQCGRRRDEAPGFGECGVFHAPAQTTGRRWPTPDVVEIAGREWTIEHIYLDTSGVPLYGCGILPLRNRREDLIEDIRRAQGPEWRTETNG
jgi:hypothetical protein